MLETSRMQRFPGMALVAAAVILVLPSVRAQQARRETVPPEKLPAEGLDEERREPQRILKIFQLEHAPLDGSLERILTKMVSGRGLVAIDRRTHSVLVEAGEEDIELIEDVIGALDRPVKELQKPEDPPSRGKQLRVLWLMRGTESGSPVPGDLKGVTEELARVGVTDLKLISQSIIRALDGFDLTAYPQMDEEPISLTVGGTISETPGGETSRLQIQLLAQGRGTGERRSPRRRQLVGVNTTVILPDAHPVVLCVNAVDDMTSVFVIQVFPVE